jgi:hypothetical protein
MTTTGKTSPERLLKKKHTFRKRIKQIISTELFGNSRIPFRTISTLAAVKLFPNVLVSIKVVKNLNYIISIKKDLKKFRILMNVPKEKILSRV